MQLQVQLIRGDDSTFVNAYLATPMDLLLNEEWLRKSIQAEEKVGGNIGAGLDWGSGFDQLLLNPELFYRLKTLRISLNREVRLLLKDWNLGTATSIASATAREKLLERFRLPTSTVKEHIQTVLQKDELFGEEFISNHQVLRELLGVMLTENDKASITITKQTHLDHNI